MAILQWDQVGERVYETGTKKGVLYPQAAGGTYPRGIAWSGLTSVSESPDGGDANDIYADDIKYLVLRGVENFGGTIEAYTYPDEWAECDGSAQLTAGVTIGQQPRKTFGFSYVSTVGNDVQMESYGYKIHLIYGASASPSERSYETQDDSPEPINFSWEFTTVPVDVTGHKPTSCITIDSTKFTETAAKAKLTALENVLYGTEQTEARLPLPDEVLRILTSTPATDPEYLEFTGSAFEPGVTYYEKSGDEYVETTDTDMDATKTYYTKV